MAARHRNPQIDSAIARAGIMVLRRCGYAQFSIDQVAKELGIPRSTIYARWRNKTDLLDDLLSSRVTERRSGSGNLDTALVALITRDLELACQPEGRAIAHLLLAAQDRPEPTPARVHGALAARRRAYLDLFDAHGLPTEASSRAADVALAAVWGRSVLFDGLADCTPEWIATLILAQLEPRAG